MPNSSSVQLKPLFPTMNSLQEVIDLAKAKFPVEQHNDVLGLLNVYHNTMLSVCKASTNVLQG